jgi:putative hemolysin
VYPSDLILYLISYLALILFSSALNMSEAALFAVPELTIRQLTSDPRRSAARIVALRRKPYHLLNTILVMNTLVVVAAAHLAESVLSRLMGDAGLWVAAALSSTLVLLFGSIIPNTYGRVFPLRASMLLSGLITALKWLLFPLIFIFTALGVGLITVLRKLFGPERERSTVEDILAVVDIAYREGTVDDREREMINRVLDLGQTRVSELMVPRVQMFVLPDTMSLESASKRVHIRDVDSFPIYHDNPEDIVGIVKAGDLLPARLAVVEGRKLADIAQAPWFVPESKIAGELIHEMWSRGMEEALVTDEYGVIVGLITREDLLEEVIGELKAHHQSDRYHIKMVDERTVISRGYVEREVASRMLGITLEDNDSESVAGYLLNKIHRIPRVGEKFDLGRLLFEVLEADDRHIISLRIRRLGARELPS